MVSSTPLSKSGPGSIAICSAHNSRRCHPLDPLGEPGLDLFDDVLVDGRGPVLPGRAADVHQDVAAPALGDQLIHLLRASRDVVDGDSPGVERGAGDLGLEGVGHDGNSGSLDQPGNRGGQAFDLGRCLDGRAGARRDGAYVQEVEAGLDELEAVLDRLLRRDAPSAGIERVGRDVHDAGGLRGRKAELEPLG